MKQILVIIASCVLMSCKKYLEIPDPATQIASSFVFDSDATATSAQLAIYSQMETDGLFYAIAAYTGLSADEFINHSGLSEYEDLATNNLTITNQFVHFLWSALYKYIYQANAVLEGVSRSGKLTPAVKAQLQGEAFFTRAICHYYLTNLFGDVSIVKTTDYISNALLVRSPVAAVYAQMIADLKEAKNYLVADYKSGINTISMERVRPNKWAAAAMLARCYLHQGQWMEAELEAGEVINSGTYSLAADLSTAFLKESPEAIFQLMAVLPGFNTFAGGNFILINAPSILSVDPRFLDSFRPDDGRHGEWVNAISTGGGVFYFPYKYKVGQNAGSITEYTVVLRLAEQLLIRAEATAMQNKLADSQSDLNLVRERAGLTGVSGLTQQDIIDSIQTERKFELMFEAGDRWINLKRSGATNSVLAPLKGINWSETDQLYPIPQQERLRNPNLSQNPGY
ncbi:MAG TPA: RagB/SusD family nutrient uptake outer membrane protein [Chitinophagaceae bacterium]|nr:RagB/SusD family nutrient uptake outer membrane protein [Chitinophagaceae bacterium]